MKNKIELKNIYYRQSQSIPEYMDIFFETDIGIFQHNVTSLDLVANIEIQALKKIEEVDKLKNQFENLYINEVRITYDNNMYLLLSDKIIVAIEYVLNSDIGGSLQEIRFIESIDDLNKTELENFNELDLISFPGA